MPRSYAHFVSRSCSLRSPFGGASRTGTGWGRIGGKYTILHMTDLRTAIIDTGRPG